MKRLFVLAIIVGILISSSTAYAVIAPGVRCPTQPKSQRGVNHIFFSFYKKSANIYGYIPQNLVLLDGIHTGDRARCLTAQSYTAFITMDEALFKDIQQNLVINSAWRSATTQSYFARTRGEFAAPPGRSEHQLGIAIDISVRDQKPNEYFGDSAVYQWMKVNAAEYGFVQSFTREDSLLFGTPEEPWHWRFVGKTIATRVMEEKININEFLYHRMEAKKKGLSY
jgi:LAS superfamily LD-carboxypeptidase LdcB